MIAQVQAASLETFAAIEAGDAVADEIRRFQRATRNEER